MPSSARRPQEQRLRALCWCSALAILVDFPMQRAGAQRTDVGVHDSRRAETRERVIYALCLALSLAAYKHARTRACAPVHLPHLESGGVFSGDEEDGDPHRTAIA
jgi:hypothetical protein